MDNLGYGEVGVYGGGILRGGPTPRIDKLAAEGTHSVPFPGQFDGLTQWEVTIAELLSGQGYATAQFGTAIDLHFNETESAIDIPCRQAHLIRNNQSRQK
jgi:arylsulfatase A-like enzyme